MISTVYIAKNVYGGDGLGRLGDGRVVFVEGAWAGEQVKAEIVEEKRHFVKAKLIEVVEKSPYRIVGEPTQQLPGMVYSTLNYEGEVKAKIQQLEEFFDRARLSVPGGVRTSEPAAGASQMLNYRNKVVYHFAKQGGKWLIGYRAEPSHEIVDLVEDPLARPEINAKLPEIRRQVLTLLTTGPEVVRKATAQKGNVTIRWSAKSGVKWWVGEAPKGEVIKETTLGHTFEVPCDGFYQVNSEVGERLVQAVVEEYRREPMKVVDLYCGVGVFGLCCRAAVAASANPEVRKANLLGIESGRQAIEFAKRNAAMLRVDAKFFAEEVGRNTRRIPIDAETTVIVDPPRGGMEPNVPKWLAASKAPRIFYVSCDPATLMRDLKTLCQTYAVEQVQFFNMFPRTARFETLVSLRRK